VTPRFLVVVPAFNEASSIEEVVRRVTSHADVCIIDDASTDGTGDRVADMPRTFVIRHERNTHIAEGILDGFRYAIEAGYDFCVTMDAGLPHVFARRLRNAAASSPARPDLRLPHRIAGLCSPRGTSHCGSPHRLPLQQLVPALGHRLGGTAHLGNALDPGPAGPGAGRRSGELRGTNPPGSRAARTGRLRVGRGAPSDRHRRCCRPVRPGTDRRAHPPKDRQPSSGCRA